MTKWIFATAVLVLTLAGSALATPVQIDFSTVGTTTDITLPNSITLNGVTFSYDNFGSASPLDTASVDSAGIFGSTFGALLFNFGSPVFGLSFDFSVLNVTPPVANTLQAFFSNGDSVTVDGGFVPSVSDPTLGDAVGRLAYGSFSAFDQATMFFNPVGAPDSPFFFTVSNVAYDPVPEPATIGFVGAGLIGLIAWRRCARQARQ